MKKLIVTIPAYNEANTISEVIKSIPRSIKGIDSIEVLVLSDGSTDDTLEVAKKAGADHLYANKQNLGLAKTFARILSLALSHDADIVVNTDADNQYDQKEIVDLIQPILDGKADMVIGNRQVKKLDWMVPAKKYGNLIGSALVRKVSGTNVTDASSGFRAFSRDCAQSFTLLSEHTYTHETIIQAGNMDIAIAEVPVIFKKRTSGQSRLISNIWTHINKSLMTIFRSVLMYHAFAVLNKIGITLLIIGGLLGLRFLYYYLNGIGSGHIQSLVLTAILVIVGVNTIFLGMIADLISHNRRMLEEIYRRTQQ